MIYIIANMLSGGGKGKVALEKAEAILTARGAEFKTLISEYPKHATLLTKKACADINCSRIIAIGGDGTFTEIINGLDLSVPISFVAAGTGNDFVGGAMLTRDTQESVEAAIDGKVQLCDLLYVNGRRCLNVAGTGWDVDVLLRERKIRKFLPGGISYTISLFLSLLNLRFTNVRIRVDGGEAREFSIFILAAANGKYYGSGLPICPEAECDDGYIDLVVVKKMPRSALPGILLQFFKGKIASIPKYVEILHCKNAEIEILDDPLPFNLDGEIIDGQNNPATVTIRKQCLQVLVPKN